MPAQKQYPPAGCNQGRRAVSLRQLTLFLHYITVTAHTRCFGKKSTPKKIFLEYFLFTLAKSFCMKFANLLAIHIHTNFYRFILIFHQMALIFPRVAYPSYLPCQVLNRPIHPENANAAFREWRNFFRHRVF